jgi:hypothetical protein
MNMPVFGGTAMYQGMFSYYKQRTNRLEFLGDAACPAASDVKFTEYYTSVAKPFGRLVGTGKDPLCYTYVTEYNGDGSTNFGKTVYQYSGMNSAPNDDPAFQGPYQYDRGNIQPFLEKKDEYKYEDGQYKLVRVTKSYSGEVNGTEFYTGFNLDSHMDFVSMNGDWEENVFKYYNDYLNQDYFATLHYSDNKGYTGLKVLGYTEVLDYLNDNRFIATRTDYHYNQYAQVTEKITTNSKGEVIKTAYKYPTDFAGQPMYDDMIRKNMLATVVEETTTKDNNTFLQSLKTNYGYWDGTNSNWTTNITNLPLPQSVETKKGTKASEVRLRYYSYDDKGNPLYVAKENDTRQVYIWGHNKTLPVAHVLNVPELDQSSVAYTSFEDESTGNWSYFSSGINDNTAPTGRNCRALSHGIISKFVSNNSNYIVSYWYKTGSNVLVSGTVTDRVVGQSKNGWFPVRCKVSGTSEVRISGNGFIDELKLYPATAQMVTFTYEPLVGITAQCDVNDNITRYQYDASGRLFLVKDDNGNVLKKICYNYQGQPDNCGDNTNALWQPTGLTRCKPCAANPAYTSGMQQMQERDNNPNSETTGTTRWLDAGIVSSCAPQPDWQFTTTAPRCIVVNGQNTGIQEREQRDMNPCSNQGVKWISVGTNLTDCPRPAAYTSQDVTGNYYSQNCPANQTPLPYYVSMPSGSYTSSSSTEQATNLARAEAQRRANVSGGCTTIYVRLVKTDKQPEDRGGNSWLYTADYNIYFYSNAAGTIPVSIPGNIDLNYRIRGWETDHGSPMNEYFESPTASQAATGTSSWPIFLNFTTADCTDDYCYHMELQLLPGRYIIIP